MLRKDHSNHSSALAGSGSAPTAPAGTRRSSQGHSRERCLRGQNRATRVLFASESDAGLEQPWHGVVTVVAFSALTITDQALQALQSQSRLRNSATSTQALLLSSLGSCGQPVSCPCCLPGAHRSPTTTRPRQCLWNAQRWKHWVSAPTSSPFSPPVCSLHQCWSLYEAVIRRLCVNQHLSPNPKPRGWTRSVLPWVKALFHTRPE